MNKFSDTNITTDNRNKYKKMLCVLLTNSTILLYNNKIILSKKYNMIDKCFLCLEEKLSVPLYCSHTICTDCYITHNDKCQYAYCNNIIKNNSTADDKFIICNNKNIELTEKDICELEILNKIYDDYDHKII